MTKKPQSPGQSNGEARKQERLKLLAERRANYVRQARRALLQRILERGTATADDVAAAITLPPDIDGRCLGAVPGAMANSGMIRLRGYTKSIRPERHASVVAEWELIDRDAAVRWLAANPDVVEPAPPAQNDGQRLLPMAGGWEPEQ